MENTNSKIVTVSFAAFAAVLAFTINILFKLLAGIFGSVAVFANTDIVRHGLPVAAGILIFSLLQFNSKIQIWADEVVVEIRKVVWPSRKDVTAMTIAVVIMVLISSVIITSFDLISGFLLNLVMK